MVLWYYDSSHQTLIVQKGETPNEITACLLWMVPQSVRILELLGNKQLFRFPFDAPEVLVTQGVLLVTELLDPLPQ